MNEAVRKPGYIHEAYTCFHRCNADSISPSAFICRQ
jgi:hypothetical protein